MPNIEEYFRAVAEGFSELSLTVDAEVLGEPGRALAAPGMSAVVEVLLRKDDKLFINDGMYGIFWELRYDGHTGFPVRAWRHGEVHEGPTVKYRVNGPTCDSADTFPRTIWNHCYE